MVGFNFLFVRGRSVKRADISVRANEEVAVDIIPDFGREREKTGFGRVQGEALCDLSL
jgi:hypothetical protein